MKLLPLKRRVLGCNKLKVAVSLPEVVEAEGRVEAVPAVAAAMLELSSFIIGALLDLFKLAGGSTSMTEDIFAAISCRDVDKI